MRNFLGHVAHYAGELHYEILNLLKILNGFLIEKMLPEVELLFHPTIINCLACSDDGELALVAGESVHVLASAESSQKLT